MQIERGTLNTLLVNARPTLTPSRWLLWFRDPERNASVYCLCSALVAGSPTLIRFEETDTPTALNGQVKLSPPGNWTLKIYEQSSTTNLNPANATRLVEERAIFVVGALEPESGWSGTGCQPGSGDDCEDATAILEDSEGAELDRQTVAAGDEVTLTAPDVTILQTDSNPALPIGTATAGSQYPLPQTVLRYDNGAGTITTKGYDTLSSDPDITPDFVIPARDLKDTDGNIVSASKVTLTDLIDDSVPGCPTLATQISAGDTEDIATFITASGKRPGVLAEIIPTVPEGDTVAQVYDVMTPAQQDLFDVTVQLQDSAANPIGAPDVYAAGTTTTKTAPDGSVTINNSVPTTLHTVAVRSNGTATQVIADSTAVIKNLNGTTLITEAIPATVSENITAPIPLKFGWGAGDADTLTWTVTDDEAGTYGTYTQDGGSGTITYSKNGGGFVAVSGAISLAVADTIVVRRTTTTNQGFSRWVP